MFQRLLIDRMENRIIVGTLAFLGIMVLTGWIAINEGARMRAFDEQFLARSIERGAALFATNCTECHGLDGRGTTGMAPGLNNPALFGYNPFAEIDASIAQLTAEQQAIATDEPDSEGRITDIDTQLADLQAQRAQLAVSLQPAIDKGYDPEHPSRLEQLGWTSTRDSFIFTTLIHGRPNSGTLYPAGKVMPAWSQLANGPLRTDQLRDLTNYVLNFDKGSDWTLEDLMSVNQFALMPGASGGAACGEDCLGSDADAAQVAEALAETPGDPTNGQALYTSLGCVGCHLPGVIAPATAGTFTRVEEERLQDPQFQGYTPEHYIVESILHPDAYIVPNFSDLMPKDFGNKLTQQDLADLVAYLESQDQPAE